MNNAKDYVILCPKGTFKAIKRETLSRTRSWPNNSKLEMLREILKDEYSHLLEEPNCGKLMDVPIVELEYVKYVAVVALDAMKVIALTDDQFADMIELAGESESK